MNEHPSNPVSAEASFTGLIAYFVNDGLINASAASSILENAKMQNISVVTYLVRTRQVTSEAILACCAKHFALPIHDLMNYDAALLDNTRLHTDLIHRYRVLPLRYDSHSLDLGISDPANHSVISLLEFQTGLQIRPKLVSEFLLDKILKTHLKTPGIRSHLETALAKISPLEELSGVYDIRGTDEEEGPLSEFIIRLISDAVEKKISDIHLEPFTDHCRIRFRSDGLLYEAATAPPHFAARMITRLKLLAQLNIAERRLPQDGRLHFPPYHHIDVRISTCPTLHGEKIVLRLLDTLGGKIRLGALGLSPAQDQLLASSLAKPQGLILVTGPTGSGKTSTLYAALHSLNAVEKNISTVEDPVEIELPGINQINVNPRIGLDFVTVLRSLLRQDPDIIMIGEIRDTQTASIAVQAAQTGHLVLSTLHTGNAIETILRMQSLGIAPYHFISAVSLIVAQRLVRKLCDNCKRPVMLNTPRIPHYFHGDEIQDYEAGGCVSCHQGYLGRTGIFECLPVTETLSSLIVAGASASELKAASERGNWMTLTLAGMEKVQSGITSLAELSRVIGFHPDITASENR